jgi:hypothetical protein
VHTPPSPAQANFTLMTECTPESRRYYSVVVKSLSSHGGGPGAQKNCEDLTLYLTYDTNPRTNPTTFLHYVSVCVCRSEANDWQTYRPCYSSMAHWYQSYRSEKWFRTHRGIWVGRGGGGGGLRKEGPWIFHLHKLFIGWGQSSKGKAAKGNGLKMNI